jgi:biotin carboxylase
LYANPCLKRLKHDKPFLPASGRLGPLRILLSEGSSTSARQAITALGLTGHHVEICDPDAHCIGRFSRYVRRFHRCPGLGVDPQGYIDFTLDLVSRQAFDVLIPIHEQGFALSAVRHLLTSHVAVALPAFEAYERAHSKAGFSTLLAELGLPQPRTQFIKMARDAASIEHFPVVLKSSIGTASRGVWIVQNDSELRRAIAELELHRAFDDAVLVQQWIDAPVEHAQAVFSNGMLLGMHAYRQIARGAGGGDAVKESVHRPAVRAHLSQIGSRLCWHGALSVDYLLPDGGEPHYIDCNPRLVEPMSAMLAGNDLLCLLLDISLQRNSPRLDDGRAGVRTHLALQALLGCAARTQSRRELAMECWRLATGRGIYSDSLEELTPVKMDWPSVIPLWAAAVWLCARPAAAQDMHKRGWGAHLLTPQSAQTIREEIVPQT